MDTCICVCICTSIYIHISVCFRFMRVYIYNMRVCICIFIYMWTYEHVYIPVLFVYVSEYLYTCLLLHACLCQCLNQDGKMPNDPNMPLKFEEQVPTCKPTNCSDILYDFGQDTRIQRLFQACRASSEDLQLPNILSCARSLPRTPFHVECRVPGGDNDNDRTVS